MVLDLGETALIFLPMILPINSDFPEFTGPISPTFKAYELGGLYHFPLYLSETISSVFSMNFSYGMSCFGVMYRIGLPRRIRGLMSVNYFGYWEGTISLVVGWARPYYTLKKCFFRPWCENKYFICWFIIMVLNFISIYSLYKLITHYTNNLLIIQTNYSSYNNIYNKISPYY